MTNDINEELNKIEKRLNELGNDRLGRLLHVNYLAILEQAKSQRKTKRWFTCAEDLR
jgi:hypothetical protein